MPVEGVVGVVKDGDLSILVGVSIIFCLICSGVASTRANISNWNREIGLIRSRAGKSSSTTPTSSMIRKVHTFASHSSFFNGGFRPSSQYRYNENPIVSATVASCRTTTSIGFIDSSLVGRKIFKCKGFKSPFPENEAYNSAR